MLKVVHPAEVMTFRPHLETAESGCDVICKFYFHDCLVVVSKIVEQALT